MEYCKCVKVCSTVCEGVECVELLGFVEALGCVEADTYGCLLLLCIGETN